MSWATKEQKGEMAIKSLETGLGLLQSWTEDTKRIKEKALEENKIDDKELEEILRINEEYTTRVNNLLYDTELGCKFKKTEDIFIMIVEIIMLDLEYEYPEIISNFTRAIDTEAFIEAHEMSIKKRQDRLEQEYQKELIEYKEEFEIYRQRLEAKKSKGFLSRLFSEDIQEPVKPIRKS